MSATKAAFFTVTMLFTLIIISTVISANTSNSHDIALDGYGVKVATQ